MKVVLASIAAAGTKITAASPNDRLLRRHLAGLTQGNPGHVRKYSFPPSLSPPTLDRQPDFAHPPPPPSSEVPEPPPLHGCMVFQARSELVDPVPSPAPAYWGSFVVPWDIQRLPQPPKDPFRPWLAHACMCLYVHVLHVLYVYVRICMYCLYVCVFDFRE